jgi:H+/Cl- antiporter ClcA
MIADTSGELGKRHRLIPQAILLGLLTGSMSVAFHLCVDMSDAFRMRFINMAHEFGNAGGMVLGREGPSVHMGGAIGQGLATLWPGKGRLDATILLAAGGGAGLTAAFNAAILGLTLLLAVGAAIQTIYPELNVDTGMFAVVGMAAYFSAVVQAPLTGIILIIEMTQNYELILPLFIACFTALVIADGFGCPPVYEALLENNFKKNV